MIICKMIPRVRLLSQQYYSLRPLLNARRFPSPYLSLSFSSYSSSDSSFASTYIYAQMAPSSQPISIAQNQRSSAPSSGLSPSVSNLHLQHTHQPPHGQSSLLPPNAHLANPRWAGTSPRSTESSSSWSIHPGPLFVSAGSLGSTSGSLGAASMNGSVGSFRAKMYPSCSPAAPLLNPLE